jgi:hypothetical protein
LLIGFLTEKLFKMAILTELCLAIMNREDCTQEEAEELIKDMKQRVSEGEDPEEVLLDEGFEPDYIFDIIDPKFDIRL